MSRAEIAHVSGGNQIVVTGSSSPTGTTSWSSSGDGSFGLGSGLSGFQLMDLSQLAGLADIDWSAIFAELDDAFQADSETGVTLEQLLEVGPDPDLSPVDTNNTIAGSPSSPPSLSGESINTINVITINGLTFGAGVTGPWLNPTGLAGSVTINIP